jgi:hypothetical protein
MTTSSFGSWRFTLASAVSVGLVLSVFVVSSMMIEFDLTLWLAANSTLIIASLAILFAIGTAHRLDHGSLLQMISRCVIYFLIVITLYVGSYAAATYSIPEKLAWMPFFHRDFTYNGYRSVDEFMNTRDNYRELLVLQIFSALLSSTLYIVAGVLGYGAASLSKVRR